jgi:hypothetical protein
LYGHKLPALLIKRRVEAYSQMATAFFKKIVQFVQNSYSADCNPGWTPSIAPVACKYLQAMQNLIQIIERLSHTHIYHVGYLTVFRKASKLVENFIG